MDDGWVDDRWMDGCVSCGKICLSHRFFAVAFRDDVSVRLCVRLLQGDDHTVFSLVQSGLWIVKHEEKQLRVQVCE